MRKVINCYADFETTTLPEGVNSVSEFFDKHKKEFDTAIYSWNIKYETTKTNIFPKGDYRSRINPEENLTDIYGINADSFYQTIINANADIVMWFNNLKSWDGHFIVPLLERKGFRPCYNENYIDSLPENLKHLREYYYKELLEREKQWEKIILANPLNVEMYEKFGDIWLKKKVDKKINLLLPYEFKLMVNKNHQIYQIELGLPIQSSKRTRGEIKIRRLVIKDSLVLFPMSIKNMGKTLKKTHTGDNWEKMDLEGGYTKDKLYNSFDEFENDGNQVDYLLQDTYILFHYHKLMENFLPRKKWKLTSASTAFNEWYQILGKKLFTKKFTNSNLIVKNYFGKEYIKNGNSFMSIEKIKDRLIEDLLPTTWLDFDCYYNEKISTHNYIYRWYSGGLTMVNEEHRGKMLSNISVFDINSSYSAQMFKNIGAPTGKPIIGDTKEKEYNWKLYTIQMKKRIVNKKGLPFIFDSNGGKREYLTVLNVGQTINVNTYEIDYMKKYYNFNLKDHNFEIKYSFKTIPMKEIFGDYVEKFYKMKEDAAKSGDEGQKNVAKLFLNSLYGKMGTKSIRESRTRLEGDWILTQETLESKYYLPLAIAITSLARLHLVDAVGENYEDFVYGDTDSIFVKNYDKNKFDKMVVDKTQLGAWDCEYKDLIGVARRPKQYLYKKKDGTVKVGFAGINFDIATLGKNDMEAYEKSLSLFKDIHFEKFLTGITIHNQLTSTRIKSGVVLNPTTKEIKPVWDYHKLSRQIRYKEEHFKKDIILAKEFDIKL